MVATSEQLAYQLQRSVYGSLGRSRISSTLCLVVWAVLGGLRTAPAGASNPAWLQRPVLTCLPACFCFCCTTGLNVEKSSLLTLIPYISMTVMTPFVGPIAGELRSWLTQPSSLFLCVLQLLHNPARVLAPCALALMCLPFGTPECRWSCEERLGSDPRAQAVAGANTPTQMLAGHVACMCVARCMSLHVTWPWTVELWVESSLCDLLPTTLASFTHCQSPAHLPMACRAFPLLAPQSA